MAESREPAWHGKKCQLAHIGQMKRDLASWRSVKTKASQQGHDNKSHSGGKLDSTHDLGVWILLQHCGANVVEQLEHHATAPIKERGSLIPSESICCWKGYFDNQSYA